MANKNTPKPEVAAAAPTGLAVETNTTFVLEDNTAVEAAPEVPVEETEVPLLGDFVQVNYV